MPGTASTLASNNPQLPAQLNQNHPKTQADWQQILNQFSSWQSLLQILVPPIQQTAAEIAAGVTPVNYAYAPGVVDRYGNNTIEGTSDMSAAAIAACKCNQYVTFRAGHTYNIANVQFVASNITVDASGSTLVTTGAPGNSAALFIVVPQSLVTSGRLAGTDYPSNWKNGSTPEPTDNDPNTMMHESTQANRVQNVTFKGINTSATINGILAYSVDGLTFRNCTMSCVSWSNVRMFHCTNISADSSNTFGGSGTYLMFGLKCGNGINIGANFSSQSVAANGRLLSFKGALHASGVSIFNASTGTTYMGATITGNFVSNLDCLAFDSTPFLTSDCNSAAQGGAGTGINAGAWYGSGGNFRASGGSYHTTASVTSGHENSAGRAFVGFDPHVGVFFENNECVNATVTMGGVQSFSISGNRFYGTLTGYSITISPTGNNPANASTSWVVSDNRDFGWTQVSGSTVAACIQVAGAVGHAINNACFSPGSGLSGLIANNGGDFIDAMNNTLFYSTPSPTYVVSGVGPNGRQVNNKMVNIGTGAYSSNFSSTFIDGGDGQGVAVSGSSFAGFALKKGATLKMQLYYQDSDGSLHLYHQGNDRITFDSSGKFGLANQTTATTIGAAGAAAALPANPLGYVAINVNGTSVKVPYYNP